MKKLNKKGFIMVETLIVTVFAVTLFILVFQVTVPTMGEYEKMYIYDDIDSVYASNLFKQMLTHYGNIPYIDENLQNKNYFEVTNCNDSNIYSNKDYCNMLKDYLRIGENDHVFVTNYDITNFKNEVRTNELFDSGSLSNFRDYVNTVPNVEKFSNNASSLGYDGKYRLFITRTITEADATTSRRYVNIGLYAGSYDKYLMGEKVYFNPVNTTSSGNLEFYVLKNSPSTDENVTLILANNLSGSNVCFSNENTTYGQYDNSFSPNTLLNMLKTKTDSWVRVNTLSNYKYVSKSGYTINYNGYRARLIDEDDIRNVLGCKNDESMCFDVEDAFLVDYGNNSLTFLSSNLSGNNGYWTAMSVPNSNLYAWSIKKDIVTPTLLSDCTNSNNTVGVRPVITVSKELVSR